MLSIVEIGYDVSPGGEREFEVYSMHEEDLMQPPIYSSTDLHQAVDYCYELGVNFEIKTLAAWQQDESDMLQGMRSSGFDNRGQLMLPL